MRIVLITGAALCGVTALAVIATIIDIHWYQWRLKHDIDYEANELFRNYYPYMKAEEASTHGYKEDSYTGG
jgi:hypothetical protein